MALGNVFKRGNGLLAASTRTEFYISTSVGKNAEFYTRQGIAESTRCLRFDLGGLLLSLSLTVLDPCANRKML